VLWDGVVEGGAEIGFSAQEAEKKFPADRWGAPAGLAANGFWR
jgi:hypothetical protein